MLINIEQNDELKYIESIYESSNLLGSKYYTESNVLYIFFKNKNKVYSYTPISETLFQELQLSTSQGEFFSKNIQKNNEITCIKEDNLLNEYHVLNDKYQKLKLLEG